ncbi:hypothetical protein TanjilG_20962 [Lupinus angustifolius]|uniref:Pectinesterase inhibitor domain-containing protein n=2 Tax=Lupinus angustifolius TaxID=3871 RepID=A0A1J7H997_LUPAN|nr:hypothetical protein TanjilG_20962 [Lupinus angustifolius]
MVSAKTYIDLANLILDLAINKATEGQHSISGFMSKNPPQAIQKCATTLYNGSISSFKKAKSGLVKDPITASYDARVAGDGPDYCADAIKEANINDPAIIYINKNVLLLSDIASIAARKLVKV